MLYNKALYLLRTNYIEKKILLSYRELIKNLKNEDFYKILDIYTTNTIINDVFTKFKTFYQKQIVTNEQLKIPYYKKETQLNFLPINNIIIKIKNKNYLALHFSFYGQKLDLQKHIFNNNSISTFIKNNNITSLHDIYINLPKQLYEQPIYNIKLIPIFKYHWINLSITFKKTNIQINNIEKKNKIMAIDLGINNLVTAVTNEGNSFIIDGRYLKSINHLYNKKLALYNKQNKGKTKYTKKIFLLTNARNKKIKTYIYKSTKYILNYAIENKISKIVIGYNKDFKSSCVKKNPTSNLNKVFNQNFVQIPLRKIIDRIIFLSKQTNINVLEINEAYTSLCSFYDNEQICYHQNYKGKRIKRGLFQTSKKELVNADVNAALNILVKSKTDSVTNLVTLRNSGIVVPKRIFIN